MSATIFRHEFLTRLRSVAVWSAAVAALMFLFFSIFPGFAKDAALINELWSKFPPELRAAFGIDKLNFATVLGFYAFLLIFVEICLAIQAGNYGFGLVSVEENELTADFLLTKPVSRLQVLNSKLLAALSAMGLTTLLTWAVSLLSVAVWNDGHEYDAHVLLLVMASLPLFQVFFLAVGLAVSLIVKRVRSVTPYSLGLGFGAYVLSAFSGMLGDVKLEYITPFKHWDPAYIVNTGAWNGPLAALNVGVSVGALALAYALYLRRDIPAAS
ncbi:MAG: ABC transporter permease subunit [Anaerolineales bacterium]|nr:ABC transporter permease subunit [Anaerolineales bacterium]